MPTMLNLQFSNTFGQDTLNLHNEDSFSYAGYALADLQYDLLEEINKSGWFQRI